MHIQIVDVVADGAAGRHQHPIVTTSINDVTDDDDARARLDLKDDHLALVVVAETVTLEDVTLVEIHQVVNVDLARLKHNIIPHHKI